MPDGIEFHGTENDHRPEEPPAPRSASSNPTARPSPPTRTAPSARSPPQRARSWARAAPPHGDALGSRPASGWRIIRQWVITTQGGYYDAFSFSVYDRAGSRIALAASPTAGTYLILPVAGARTKEYNYDTLMGKWVCTTTTSDTAKPTHATLLLRAKA